MPAPSPSRRTVRAAARALRAQFFVSGALFATWGVHVPTFKQHYGVGEQALAFALLAAGAGALLVLLQAGRVLHHQPPRRVVPATALVCVLAVGAMLTPSAYALLAGLMLAYGAAAALFDVAINDEATAIEAATGQPLMAGFHGMFSLGGMAGAGAWSLLAAAGVAPEVHLVGAAAALGLLALGAAPFLLRLQRGGGDGTAPLSLPRGPLALLGLLAGIGLIAEGAMYDWSVLFLRQERSASAPLASLAYASFSGAMAAGRFAGDWVRARLAPVPLLRISGLLGGSGMVLALVVPHPYAALAGFALAGLGFANIVPVLFSAAGRVPGIAPAQAIAAVSSVGYLGMMSGPPLIGFIAEARSLSQGLLTVVVFAAVVAALARRALAGHGSA